MLQITINDKQKASVTTAEEGFLLNGQAVDWNLQLQPNGLISILYNGKSYIATIDKVDKAQKQITLSVNGNRFTTTISEPIDQLLASMGLDIAATKKAEPVKAPMPGMILKVMVTPGQQIHKGDALLILEAMKMENVLKATASATVKAIRVLERTTVEKGAVLIDLE